MSFQHHLVLVHGRTDGEWTRRLAQRLQTHSSGSRPTVQVDEHALGADLGARLAKALETSRWVGLVLTPDSAERLRRADLGPMLTPGAPRLLPLLLGTCEVPEALLPLRRIDFRYPWELEQRLTELTRLLGEGVLPEPLPPADPALLREDGETMRQLKPVFEQDALTRPCVDQLRQEDLEHAINHVTVALNTGKRVRPGGQVLGQVPDKTRFRSELFRSQLAEILLELQGLRQDLMQPNGFQLWDLNELGGFYAAALKQSGPMLHVLVQMMDAIDHRRNVLLGYVNRLLETSGEKPLPYVRPSSTILCLSDRPKDVQMAVEAGLIPPPDVQRAS